MDHFCYSFDFVASGNDQWLRDGRVYSYPPGDRHCRGADSNYSGPKTVIVFTKEAIIEKTLLL